MLINNRLKSIANLINEDDKVLDVGCDHALLDIYLKEHFSNMYVVASDNKKGPLEKAKENLKKYEMTDKIILRLADGIDAIDDKIDTVVISGMGGLNIIGILKYKPDKLTNIKKLILSPNSDYEELRREITKLGFYIEYEEIVKENNKFYLNIVFLKGKKHYTKEEYLFGPILLKKPTKLSKELNELELNHKKNLVKVLPKKYFYKKLLLNKEIRMREKIIDKA